MAIDGNVSIVNIDKDELTREINNKGKYYMNVVHWTLLFSISLFMLVDYLFLPLRWTTLFLSRSIVCMICYSIYVYGNKMKWQADKYAMFITGINIALDSCICAYVEANQMMTYFMILTMLVLLVNSTLFWDPIYPVYQCLLSYIIIGVSFPILNRSEGYDILISNGGGLYFILSIFSVVIARNRFVLIKGEIEQSIFIEKSQNRLIEQREKIEEQQFLVKDAHRKLKNLSEQRFKNMSMVVHDFKNFTDSIQMSLDVINNSSSNFTEEQKEILGYIHSGNDKIKYLTERLATGGKESVEINFNFTTLDICKEVESSVLNITDAATMKKINIQLHTHPVELMVSLDKIFIEQLLYRLLINVVRFAQSSSILAVYTQKVNDSAVIEVINKGRLIGMKKLDELLNKLDRDEEEDRPLIQESLGLSVSKRLTEQMGGIFSYNSSEAVGNYFRLEFKLLQ